MGDRGNVFFVDRKAGKQLAGIYMYTHWSGAVLPGIVQAALARGRGRWGDSQYLARILFCELVQEAVLEETGYGLGTTMGDNEHKIVRVDDLAQRVSYHEPGRETNAADKGIASWSYEQFLEADVLAKFASGEEDDDDEDEPVALPKAKAKVKAKPKAKAKAKKPAAKKRRSR